MTALFDGSAENPRRGSMVLKGVDTVCGLRCLLPKARDSYLAKGFQNKVHEPGHAAVFTASRKRRRLTAQVIGQSRTRKPATRQQPLLHMPGPTRGGCGLHAASTRSI